MCPHGRPLPRGNAPTDRPVMAKLIPGSFTVDHLGIYPGFVRSDDADGPTYPLFTLDVAQRIAADWVEFEGMPDEPPPEALYDAERDVFRLFEPATGQWHELAGERFGPNVLYAMGRDLWTWQRTHEDE